MAQAVYGDIILRIQDVHQTYGTKEKPVPVLKGVSAEVHDLIQEGGPVRPQVVAFIGPSGSGKTTLFRAIAGVEQPTSGAIFVGIDGVRVRPGMVGVVSQDYIVFEYLTVFQNLIVPARLAGLSRKAARELAKEYLDRFKLLRVGNNYPTQLSGGQRQRLAILRQLISSAPTAQSGSILLMDEPFSGLDPVAKNNVGKLIMDVASTHEKNTVIITSHDVRSALKIADTVWVLGRDSDEQGKSIPGAYIHRVINLIDLGLAWEPGITEKQAFQDLENEIELMFERL